ncbi:histidine phosphatase family protein [uncultured Amnibacterium sp.]|uniref:histidine phosphatase family protein n=1 Tax=uncultured Amnibacterium sp. TaxID=1631851 RepID=UPI0035CA9717
MVARALHLVRHGEVHNPAGVVYERLPEFRLSARGAAMAATTADRLAAEPVTRLIASPLLRTQQSAQPIADRFGLPIEPDERTIESWNRFAGRAVKESVRRHPQELLLFRNPLRPTWGEPFTAVRDRMRSVVLEALRDGDPDHDVVIVSHQLPIWMVHRSVEGAPLAHDPRRRRCALSSITSFAIRDGHVVEIGYEDPAATVGAVDEGAA